MNPLFTNTNSSDLFDKLLFQLRCNEAIFLVREREYKKSLIYFTALTYCSPRLDQEILGNLRKEFRDKMNKDIEIQIFDSGTLYHYLGLIYFAQINYSDALENFNQSLFFRENNGQHLDLLETLINIGSANLEQSNTLQALKYYERAIIIAEHNNSKEHLVLLYSNIAKIYLYDFDFVTALSYAQNAYNISLNLNPKIQQNAMNRLGKVFQYLKHYDDAISYFEDSLHILLKHV